MAMSRIYRRFLGKMSAEKVYRKTVKEIYGSISTLEPGKQRAWIIRKISKAPDAIRPSLERKFNVAFLKAIEGARGPEKARLQKEYEKFITGGVMPKTKVFFTKDWSNTLRDFDMIANSPALKEVTLPGPLGWINALPGIYRAGRKISIGRVLDIIKTYRDQPDFSAKAIAMAIRLLAHNNRLGRAKSLNIEKEILSIYTQKALEKRALRILASPVGNVDAKIYGFIPALLYRDIRDAFSGRIKELAEKKLA